MKYITVVRRNRSLETRAVFMGFSNTTKRSCSNINKQPAEGAKQF